MNQRTPAARAHKSPRPDAAPQPAATDAPVDVWHTLQQSIGNAAIGRMRRVQHQAQEEDATPVDASTQGQIDASRDAGKPLSSSVQQQMAPHFGPDVSDVRVHDDAEAGSM